MDKLVYEAKNFIIKVPSHPHVDREDGGHLIVEPRVYAKDRTQLAPDVAIELMKLTMVAGEAMDVVLNEAGIDLVRINYQDNGNWGFHNPNGPCLHVHLYGRAKSSKLQKHGEALVLPSSDNDYYKGLRPLTEEDAAALKSKIETLMNSDKYWGW
jgi:diadenosine tetraphosphate (Ap4A) HIT family hydrolase